MQAKAGITQDIIEVLTATSAELSKGRRKRPMPAGLAAPGSFDHYKLLSSHPLHKTSEVGVPSVAQQGLLLWLSVQTVCCSCFACSFIAEA